jgi:hypothetical protein
MFVVAGDRAPKALLIAINTTIGLALLLFTRQLQEVVVRSNPRSEWWIRDPSTLWGLRLGGAILLAFHIAAIAHLLRPG